MLARAALRLARPAAPALSASLRSLPQRIAAPAASRLLSTAPAEDIDVDNVAYGFMASQALFTGLEMG
eukprot:1230975-Prymnesium_polylepis.1